jgi:hypothetical protein
MSSIYASGVHATAITNIKAAINSRIVTRADGSKVLDVESVKAWAIAQFQQMITDAEATSAAYVSELDPSAAINTCAAIIDPAHWSGRTDWPTHLDDTSAQGAVSVAAVAAQQAKLKRLAQAATAYFADTPALLEQTLTSFFLANIEPTIARGTTLLEENRAYVCTYVTDRGEESAWSPVSALVETDQNDTVTIVVPAAPSGRFITHFRIYRSSTTNTEQDFEYVPNPADEEGWPIGTLTVTDEAKQAELERAGPTQLWDEPPADLRGLVGGANGGMAGFRGNEFCPCVPYVPYAFPEALRITTEWPIVGLATHGQTYFVGTRGRPYFVSGADTQSLIAEKLDADQPCMSKRGIVAMAGGFLFPSPDGICLANGAGVKVITGPGFFDLFDREAWQALDPSSIVAAEAEGCYVFRWDNGTTNGIYSLDVVTGKLIALTNTASTLYRDAVTDRLYCATGLAINAMFASATKRNAQWRTKVIELDDYPRSRGCRRRATTRAAAPSP